MDVVTLVALISTLFVIIGLSEPLAERLRLPYTVILAGMGVLLATTAAYFLATTITDALNPVARVISDLPIRANVFLYVFLPTLLFQVSLSLNLRRMQDDWVPILVLAVVAVVVATFTVGYALNLVSGLSLMACLLIGAIVSTTDPSAVVSIFRNIAAPQRLTRIVEGESLLNDAAAIALFGLFITFVIPGVAGPTLSGALATVPVLTLGGAFVGWFLARIAIILMARLWHHPMAQVSVSIALPYLAYVAAEQAVGASGVIAVVVAGMTLNLIGPGRLSPQAWGYLREVWQLLAHWAGSLIFVLAALLIPRLLGEVRLSDIALILAVILAATLARGLVLFGVMPLLSFLRISPQVQGPYRLAILWGGLRGAVTLALALAVTENPMIPTEVKRLVGILATGFTLFTLIAQGTTLRLVISRLGLDRLSPIDTALSNQVIAVALQTVREDVSEVSKKHTLPREIVRTEAKLFARRLDAAVEEAEKGAEILDRDRITLGLVALAGRERDLILEHFRQQIISTRLVERMLSDSDRLIERTRAGGRTEYRRTARFGLGHGRAYRLAVWLNNRLRISAPLAQLSADRFELLLNQRLILRDLHGYIDTKIRRIHGRRVAELLHELLERREEEVDNALEGLRLQYPGYAEELERRFIRRTALRFEEREYDQLHADGLVGPELYTKLKARLVEERTGVERRPRLDLAVQKTELVKQFPLFADMSEVQRRRLARALVAVYAAPGDVLIRKGEVPRRIYFIASGAVEMERAGVKHRFGRGEMFGQLAFLTRTLRRQAQVTAISHSTFLSLDESQFLRLLGRNRALRDAVRESAERRGVRLPDGALDMVAELRVPQISWATAKPETSIPADADAERPQQPVPPAEPPEAVSPVIAQPESAPEVQAVEAPEAAADAPPRKGGGKVRAVSRRAAPRGTPAKKPRKSRVVTGRKKAAAPPDDGTEKPPQA